MTVKVKVCMEVLKPKVLLRIKMDVVGTRTWNCDRKELQEDFIGRPHKVVYISKARTPDTIIEDKINKRCLSERNSLTSKKSIKIRNIRFPTWAAEESVIVQKQQLLLWRFLQKEQHSKSDPKDWDWDWRCPSAEKNHPNLCKYPKIWLLTFAEVSCYQTLK